MELNIKKRMFYIFLFINALAWSCLCLCRNIMGNDALEAISWGELLDFGTNKHPPLSGWLAGGVYNILGHHDFVVYLLGQLCILTGFIYIYKLSKFFLDEEKAISASIIMSSCYYYTYVFFYENYNCNFLSMAIWPMIVYYFYKSVKTEKTLDWILFGIVSALGLLTKYQVIFLYLALFLYILLCDRSQFKKRGMYISIFVGGLLILPHILFLLKTEFFSFIYMTERVDVGSHNTPLFLIKHGRIVFPLKFIFDQILSVLSCIIVYLFIASREKNISFNKDSNISQKIFLLLIMCVPIVAQSFMAFAENNRILGMWGSMMVSFTGLGLFYFFPISFKKDTFIYVLKWAYSLLALWLAGMFIFAQLQTKLHMSFPYQEIIPKINHDWDMKTNNADLKYIGGNINYVFKLKEYNPRRPKIILETFGYKNPWVNHEDVISSGALIVGKSEKNLAHYTRELVILLPKDYIIKSQKCEFVITNKFGKTKKYKFYYAIIPPIAND